MAVFWYLGLRGLEHNSSTKSDVAPLLSVRLFVFLGTLSICLDGISPPIHWEDESQVVHFVPGDAEENPWSGVAL